MIARFRRTLLKAHHRISLILIINQDQQRLGWPPTLHLAWVFGAIFSAVRYCPQTKNPRRFFCLRNRFQVLDCSCQTSLQSRFGTQPQSARRSQRHAGQLQNIGDSLTTRVRRARPSNTSKPNYFRFFTTVSHVWWRRNKWWRGLEHRHSQAQVATVHDEEPETHPRRWCQPGGTRWQPG